MKEKPNDSVKL